MFKRKFKKYIFVPFLVLPLFLFIEACLRLISYLPVYSRVFVNDENIGYRMRPHIDFGGAMTNSYGFNDIDHSLQKKKNITRIAFIGDSITFGLPLKGNFVFLLEQDARNEGVELEAFNMGLPGADPEIYLKILKHDAVKMHCDTIGIIFFVGNDIIQAHPDLVTKLHLGYPAMVIKHPWKISSPPEYLFTYRFLRIVTRVLTELIWGRDKDGTFTRNNFLDIEKYRIPIYRNPSTPFINDCYVATFKIIRSLADQAKERKMKFFIVLVPDEIQLNDDLRQDLFNTYKLDLREYDFSRPQQLIKEYLKSQGIICLDLFPYFQVKTKQVPLYIKQDSHWNKSGHDIAALQIWNFIKENKLM